MAYPLTVLFQTSLRKPEEWKDANVTPVFKKGSRTDVNNYWPVSLTSVCCKVCCKVLEKTDQKITNEAHD